MSTRPFELTVRQRHNIVIDVNVDGFTTEGEHGQWFLLRSDAHQDNPHSCREMEERHLEQAIKRNAIILDNGDLFCAMEGKGDRRGAKNLRPENVAGNYLDTLVSYAANRYEKYAHLWPLMAMGNHETAVLSHKETNLTERLTACLTDRTGHHVQAGGMTNWVTIRVGRNKIEGKGRGTVCHYRMYMHHGFGGGGPVTMDAIQGQRKMAELDGVDCYMSGHTHGKWVMPRMKAFLDSSGLEAFKEVQTVKLPTYKDEFLTEGRGFHHEKGRGPKPLGAMWMHLKAYKRVKNGKQMSWVEPEFHSAN